MSRATWTRPSTSPMPEDGQGRCAPCEALFGGFPVVGGSGPGPWEVEILMARPQIGQDRYWVVWSRGEVVPAV
eukprot:6337961-Lingulodinium_polyedra.AAC.1